MDWKCLEDLANNIDGEGSCGFGQRGIVGISRMNRHMRRTEVEEDSGSDGLLDGKGSLGLQGADLLLGLLRGGDCATLAHHKSPSLCHCCLNIHPPNILSE